MNFTKLKEKKIRKTISKLSKKNEENRVVSQDKIKSIGILTTDKVSSQLELQSEIESTLGVRNTKIYSFRRFNKTEEISYRHFSEKDVNWKGEFHQQNFKSFLEQPFDLLIAYFDDKHLYLELATLQSRASFKVGFSQVNYKLFDIDFSLETIDIQQFSSELKKYLSILNKL
ncbi:DUF6913 domain-containing protein [Polaribacter sp. WD7]|uniref:DUF6913 domain-containing protein n=1 Tax=Polaribacter sp. WD7 TaxID=2269061 RepID=UPI0021622BC1|nr:hypothetical protein [Polaribacter sp. WD7]